VKISIVTVSYNQAKFLERAILSVINQNYDDLEYIIVDPGSTDESKEIIERYRSNFSHVIFEPDIGAADGLNKGFNLASGEIFGFLNSDDILLPNVLFEVDKYFQDYPDIDVVSGHTKIINSCDRVIRNSYSDRFSLIFCAYGASVLMQPSTFFRASYYRIVKGFNKNNISNWDGELFVDIAINGGKFGVVNKFWSCYRLHAMSITSSKKLDLSIKQYGDYIFSKIMGRPKQVFDLPITCLFRVLKYLYSPKSLYERIMKGAIYGQSSN
jgi:glycosyltransferase involved in cell wall biosynthesis